MNNNIEVIGIDHGWSQIKTNSTCFGTSVRELPGAPAFHDNVLEYGGRYYVAGNDRLDVLDSKVENQNFYLLTLIAIAKELKIRGKNEADIVLAGVLYKADELIGTLTTDSKGEAEIKDLCLVCVSSAWERQSMHTRGRLSTGV